MSFKPNFDLLVEWKDVVRAREYASASTFIAKFKHGNKTLVYMCDVHRINRSFDMVDFCFSDEFSIKPDVLLTEMENSGYERKFSQDWIQDNTLSYAAVVASQRHIPMVFADLSDEQMVDVIQVGFPDEKISTDILHKVLRAGPTGKDGGNIYNKMCAYLAKNGRDRFMLENIAIALNKYDTVFAIFGAGHYENQRLVLEDMMGKPEYITKIKNMRGDFLDAKIEPIKLCDFEMVEIGEGNGKK